MFWLDADSSPYDTIWWKISKAIWHTKNERQVAIRGEHETNMKLLCAGLSWIWIIFVFDTVWWSRLEVLLWGGLGSKGSDEVVGRNDVPFGMLLLSKQQMTPYSPISCQLSASPDHLWRMKGREKILCSSLLLPVLFHFLPSPSLVLFPSSLLESAVTMAEAAGGY